MTDQAADIRKVRAVRPRLAASLVLTRGSGERLEVLMGRRHADVRFLPNKYVFPGGRMERDDARLIPAHALDAALAMQFGPRAQALALAAIRETFEETGIVVGHPAGTLPATIPHQWKAFTETGHAPALDRISGLARAVTPPQYPIRFDTYFFTASVDDLPAAHAPLGIIGGELEEICWRTPKNALALDTIAITKIILQRLIEKHTASGDEKAQAIPYYRKRGAHYRPDKL